MATDTANGALSAEAAELARMIALQAECGALVAELGGVLAYEAWLLDNGHYEHWLALLADDLRYVAPVRRKIAEDFPAIGALDEKPSIVSHFNDGKGELAVRVRRFRTNFDHYDRPRSLMRRIIGNVLIQDCADRSSVTLTSNFILFRAREEKEETLFVGARDDIWRRSAAGQWELTRRLIKLDHHQLPPISVLF